MRRGPLIALIVAAVLTVTAPGALAADVTVNFARDGGSKTVALNDLSGSFDVNSQYTLVAASGQATTRQINGISLRSLLEAVGADPTYSAVTIARPSGGNVRISRAQIEAGGLGPVVYDDAGLANFVRPSYSATDRNAEDVISAAPLVITQVDGTDYDLKAKISKRNAKVGERLRFSASATGAAGQKLIFNWNFNDGQTGSGDAVTHRFSKRGYYRVLVSVRGEGETASVSTVITVQVGKAVKSKRTREGGGTNDAAGAPLSGRADGSSGNGAQAAPNRRESRPKKKQRKQEHPVEPSDLQTVTGELLGSPERPQQSDLAARSGQQLKSSGLNSGIPGEAAGAAVALGLLGFGAALEFGLAGRLRRRLLV